MNREGSQTYKQPHNLSTTVSDALLLSPCCLPWLVLFTFISYRSHIDQARWEVEPMVSLCWLSRVAFRERKRS